MSFSWCIDLFCKVVAVSLVATFVVVILTVILITVMHAGFWVTTCAE